MYQRLTLLVFFFCLVIGCATVHGGARESGESPCVEPVVRGDQQQILVSTEHGQILAANVSDGAGGRFHLQFITMEPNALFLPSVLHADMVLYVRSGIGRLSWVDKDEMRRIKLVKGDVYRMPPGTVFFIESNNVSDAQQLRIHSIFTNSVEDLHEPSMGAYSPIRDLLLGFDKKVIHATFKVIISIMVPEEVVEEITSGEKEPTIVEAPPRRYATLWELQNQFMKGLWGVEGYSMFDPYNKKYKAQTFNILKETPDVENCNGWSLTATRKQLPSLRHTNIAVFMVNLTKGSMMGPHWNQMASEISIVVKGRGMVRVVCSSPRTGSSECKNRRLRVEEGDVFVVPRFHSVSQISFNNDSFVFIGFTITKKKEQPQYMGGQDSVLQVIDKLVLAASFNVSNTTIDQLLAPKGESVILECTSCAEEEERIMEEEIEKREEPKRREKEEERRREEEEKRRKETQEKQKEEEKRREEGEREEEEASRQEEERREEEQYQRRKEREQGEEDTRREEATRVFKKIWKV
ncbi:hypothetical protein NMG60_11008009 [Bertholletia excelsa]